MPSFSLFQPGESSQTPSAPAAPLSEIPSDHPPIPAGIDACPVDHSTRSKWLAAAQSSDNEAHPLTQATSTIETSTSRPRPALGTDRVVSSIPRAANWLPSSEGSLPHTSSSSSHSNESAGPSDNKDDKWVYPSEAQFFAAMQRKNHKPRHEDMKTVVPIHNAVNEKAWEEVLMWEAGMGSERCGGPRLVSFTGRPKDLTPKAWFKTLTGYTPPFDRHDWIVDRCGTQVRYVIDFYTGKSDPSNPNKMAFYLDVRPAVDNWEGIKTRWAGLWR